MHQFRSTQFEKEIRPRLVPAGFEITPWIFSTIFTGIWSLFRVGTNGGEFKGRTAFRPLCRDRVLCRETRLGKKTANPRGCFEYRLRDNKIFMLYADLPAKGETAHELIFEDRGFLQATHTYRRGTIAYELQFRIYGINNFQMRYDIRQPGKPDRRIISQYLRNTPD